MVLREGSHGKFYGCSTYPKCDGTREKGSAEKKDTVPRKKPLKPNEKKNTVPRKSPLNPNSDDCPLCGSKMKLRKGPHGEFFGCSTYPKCKGTGKK
jgi:DNA topoisomerase-1